MTDALGRSQVIPYLAGLAKLGNKITLLSCEKTDRFATGENSVRSIMLENGIRWIPSFYHKNPPVLSTVWDLRTLRRTAFRLQKAKPFDVVHCRSYIASLIGLEMKRRWGTRFIFDMRGFWADERVDGGLWNLKNPIYATVYRFFKRKEKDFLNESDYSISLTHVGRDEIKTWDISDQAKARIEIIPCCVDIDHFSDIKIDASHTAALRKSLGISENDFVVTYLGSIGTWYCLDEMLNLFALILKKKPAARFLFITPENPKTILTKATALGIDPAKLTITHADRAQVPSLLRLSSVGLFFIKPVYSKKSSSPTKLGEILSMGIPVIANSGMGDNDWTFSQWKIGHLVKDFSTPELSRAVDEIDSILKIPASEIRNVAESYFSLEEGVKKYRRVYETLK
jgi:glycosyltransferase involved in cell wall biosynthesis